MSVSVDLDRDFLKTEPSSVDVMEPDTEQSLLHFRGHGLKWSDLLKWQRVIMFGEAGSGKTFELRAQVEKQSEAGLYSFYIPLERLAHRELKRSCPFEEAERIDKWLLSEDQAYFFLDAADEAKLLGPGAYEDALSNFQLGIGGALPRVNVVLTCRPSDWKYIRDLELFQRYLPPIRRRQVGQPSESDMDENQQPPEEGEEVVRLVRLCSLSGAQTRKFAAAQEIVELNQFMAALGEGGLGMLARRPFDLQLLAGYWQENGKFGTLTEMLGFAVGQLLREEKDDTAESRPITPEKALFGALCLGAANTFCNRINVASSNEAAADTTKITSIDPREVLPEWKKTEIAALLSLPLFDQAAFGHVKIHHRTFREFLAAKWLEELLRAGKPRREIERLIIGRAFDRDVLIPSRLPIAGWLAVNDKRIRERMLAIAPESFLEYGDTSSLSSEFRSRILHRVVERIVDEEATDGSVHISGLRRLACPELSQVAFDFVAKYPTNDRVCDLMIRLAWMGEFSEFEDIAVEFALNFGAGIYTRVVAIRLLGALNAGSAASLVVESALLHPNDWGRRLRGAICEAFFPGQLSSSEVVALAEASVSAERFSVDTFADAIKGMADSGASQDQLVTLLEGLTTLLGREPFISDYCQVSERFSWLAEPVAHIVKKLIDAGAEDTLEPILRAFEIAAAYAASRDGVYSACERLRGEVRKRPHVNHLLLWRAAERVRPAVEGKGKRLNRWYSLAGDRYACRLDLIGLDPILMDVTQQQNLDDKQIAMSLALSIWEREGRPDSLLDQIRPIATGIVALEELVELAVNPPPLDKDTLEYQREHEKYEKRWAAKKRQEKAGRIQWIARLKSDPERLRNFDSTCPVDVLHDLIGLSEEVRELSGSNQRYGEGSWRSLAEEFGKVVAVAARDGLIKFWRISDPELESRRDDNTIPWERILGLLGLHFESSERKNWVQRLLPEESILAAKYGLCELNGIPPWFAELLSVYPDKVDIVVASEVGWELALERREQGSHHVLAPLSYADESVREHYVPLVLEQLEIHDPENATTLESALQILMQSQSLDIGRLSRLARSRFKDSNEPGRQLTWLSVLFYVDAVSALAILRDQLSSAPTEAEAKQIMANFCSSVMDHHALRFRTIYSDFDQVKILREIVPLAYRYIPPDEDVAHTGSYSPGPRDDAASTRGYFLELFTKQPGIEANKAILDLANETTDQYRRLRFLEIAQEHAAISTEPEHPWKPKDVPAFGAGAGSPPSIPRELFQIIVDRLDDIRLDLESGDVSLKALLQKLTEPEAQIWLGDRLRQEARSMYDAPREVELANKKKPDYRFNHPTVDSPVPLEIKIADNWSLQQLEDGLGEQLFGQYMGDRRTGYGVYLLVRKKKLSWRKTSPAVRCSNFEAIITHLQEQANGLVAARSDVEEVRVIGIDLMA